METTNKHEFTKKGLGKCMHAIVLRIFFEQLLHEKRNDKKEEGKWQKRRERKWQKRRAEPISVRSDLINLKGVKGKSDSLFFSAK